MSRKKIKLSLFLFPILVIVILGANSEYAEESQTSKQRLTMTESFQGQGSDNVSVDQDELSSEREQRQHQIQPFGRVIIPSSAFPYSQLQWVPAVDQSQLHSIRLGLGGPGGNPRKKKDCGFPVLTRRLIGPVMKRAQHALPYFANSDDEILEKSKEEDATVARTKRSDGSETHSGGCLAKRQWIDMGGDYYPRYVKSYHCSSNACDRGFGTLGECKPKHYVTKVLKRITPKDATTIGEDCDLNLPEALRVDWKLVSVTVTTCCDCVSPGRLFGLK